MDDSTDPSLMWALRGGGGEFGIVTAMEIALAPAPALSGGRLLFPVDDAPRVWRAFAEVTSVAPRELTLFASVVHFPKVPELPEQIRGRSFTAVDAVLLGDHATLAMLLQRVTDPVCGLMQARVRHLGGAFRDDPARPAACGRVDGEYVAMMLAMAPVPEAARPAQTAIDLALDLLRQWDAWDAGPTTLSMLGHHGGADHAFTPDTLRRLRDVKESADPRCVVRGNFPVHGSSEIR